MEKRSRLINNATRARWGTRRAASRSTSRLQKRPVTAKFFMVLTQFFYLPLINTPGALSFSDQKLEKFPPELTKVIKSLTMIKSPTMSISGCWELEKS